MRKGHFDDTARSLNPRARSVSPAPKTLGPPQQHHRKDACRDQQQREYEFRRLRFVTERAAMGEEEEKEAMYAVTIPEERGSYRRILPDR